jgi:glyoxylase I family protein
MAIDVRGMAPLLQVFDMPASIAFYCDVLGFEIVGTDGKQVPDFDWVLLRLQGVELMLDAAHEAADRPPKRDLGCAAAYRDVGLFFGCPDVEAVYKRTCGRWV